MKRTEKEGRERCMGREARFSCALSPRKLHPSKLLKDTTLAPGQLRKKLREVRHSTIHAASLLRARWRDVRSGCAGRATRRWAGSCRKRPTAKAGQNGSGAVRREAAREVPRQSCRRGAGARERERESAARRGAAGARGASCRCRSRPSCGRCGVGASRESRGTPAFG